MSHQNKRGAIAQLVEQRTENPCVPGSIPGGTTTEGKMKIFPFFVDRIMAHKVYIIYSKSANCFYAGETVNVPERVKQHNSGKYKCAFSKQATDWKLFWTLECKSRVQAMKIEKHIKKMRNRNFYQSLNNYPELSQKLLDRFPP